MNRTMEAIVWAMNAKGLSSGAWKLLVMLARRVGKRGFDVWPSHKRLADDCEMSVSSVRRYLAEIEALKFVEIIATFDERGDRRSNLYRLQVRANLAFPAGAEITIGPDDDDGDIPLPPVQSEQGGGSKLNRPPVQSEQTPLFNVEQAELIPEGTNSREENPFHASHGVFPEESLEAFVERRWGEITTANEGIAKVRKIDAGLVHTIEQRGKSHARDGETPRDVWEAALRNVETSDFLRGRAPPGKGRTQPFRLSLGWMCKASNFREILGGRYNGRPAANTVDERTGRQLGPTGQALAGAVARFRAGREQQPGGGRRDPQGYLPGPPA